MFTPTPLTDVRAAFDAIPLKGRDTVFAGTVDDDGDPNTHIQGLVAIGDFFLLTHSDATLDHGRILIVRRAHGALVKVDEWPTPVISGGDYAHAGGAQLVGSCLVVPVESGSSSHVLFLDVSDPLRIVEIDPTARVPRTTPPVKRKAGTAGMTLFEHNGTPHYLLCAQDRGKLDFYMTPQQSFPHGWDLRVSSKVPDGEKEHAALLLFTDTAKQVWAIGLNRTAAGDDKICLYTVTPASGALSKVSEVQLTTTGGNPLTNRPHLRWGSGLEQVGDALVLHCTSHRYGKGCHINTFDPSAPAVKTSLSPTMAMVSAHAALPATPAGMITAAAKPSTKKVAAKKPAAKKSAKKATSKKSAKKR